MASEIDIVVHATHEAGYKVGGIGAALDGLLTQPAYTRAVRRTVLVGPFNPDDPVEMERLYAPRNGLQVRYSAPDNLREVPPELAQAFTRVELYFHVRLLYGTRKFGEVEHEIILVDARNSESIALGEFKYFLFKQFGIDSARYAYSDEYEYYLRAAEPSYAALSALVNGDGNHRPRRAVVLAHEWLGLPLAFSASLRAPDNWRTVFYAHEVATIRPLVEDDRGHDTRFYNVMRAAEKQRLYLQNIFGDQSGFYKHALLMAASRFDGIFAVSDITQEELRFLSPEFAARAIALVYNGVPSATTTFEQRRASKNKLRQYAQNLLGARPSWIFTHVTRMVLSKGLWRDLRVLEQLDAALAARGERAVLFTLSSTIPQGRRSEDVFAWEQEYGWPVNHRAGNGDLEWLEVDYYNAIETFNRNARASRVVLVNQFGWSRDRCGERMPADMEYNDLRRGTDLEFGQSVYEPFGIAQLEPLSAGALCVVSDVCGCVGFIQKANGLGLPNIIVSNYTAPPPGFNPNDWRSVINIGAQQRDEAERAVSAQVAEKIIARLPRDDAAAQRMLEEGRALAERMSWRVVVEEELVPALRAVSGEQ